MLTSYASQALAVLQKLLPDLASLAVEQDDIFQISLITPAGWEFWLYSDEKDQLTVKFAEYRCQFGNYQGTTAEIDATNAAEFIQEIRNGEMVLAVWYRGDEYAWSSFIVATEEPQSFHSGENLTVKIKRWA